MDGEVELDLDAAPEESQTPVQPEGGRRRALAAGAAVLVLLGGGLLLGRDGGAEPAPTATFHSGLEAALVQSRTDPADLSRLDLTVDLRNTSDLPALVERLQVEGLGRVMLRPPPDRTIPPGGLLSVPASVLPDCGTSTRPALSVLVALPAQPLRPVRIEPEGVGPGSADDPAQSADRVLRPACPRRTDGFSVSVVGAAGDAADPGILRVRVVNHGRWAAVVEASPASPDVTISGDTLPLRLGAGQSAVLPLRISVQGCAGTPASDPVGLVAGGSAGWRRQSLQVPVRQQVQPPDPGFWSDAVAAAARAACRADG